MTQEVSPARKALTAVILAAVLFAAVVIQLTVVNRLPLPGATAPDLVLLLVTAIAVATGPAVGALIGFAGGLALDVAPPAAHYAGEYALVFCLACYAAARITRAIWDTAGTRDPVTTFAVMAAAAAAGEAGKAALGMLLSDPDVTTAAVSRALPGAVLYDLLLAPLGFLLVVRVTRGVVAWNTTAERGPAAEFGRPRLLAPVSRQTAFRQAGAGAAPNLRLAGTGRDYQSPSPARSVPKLRLSDARAGSSLRTHSAYSSAAPFPATGGRTPKLDFSGNRPTDTARRTVRTPGKNWLSGAPTRPAAATPIPGGSRRARIPGKNWLRSPASPALPAAKRAARSPSRGWLSASGAGGRANRFAAGLPHGLAGTGRQGGSPVAARSPKSPEETLAARSAPSGMSALSGARTPLAGRRSPRSGWLRSTRAAPSLLVRRVPRSGWLSGGRPRTVIGSSVGGRRGAFRHGGFRQGRTFRQGRALRANRYAGSASEAWPRRGRHPWRSRGERLLRLVGVGR